MKRSALIISRPTVFIFLLATMLFYMNTASASHCEPTFNNDISGSLPPVGGWGNVVGDCSGIPGCNDYFDFLMCPGATITLSFCQMGGSVGFDSGLSVWNGPGFTNEIACADDQCGDGSELSFTAATPGVYRFRIGVFQQGSQGGTYNLAVNLPNCAGQIPTMGEWGLIILFLSLMSIGTVFFMKTQNILSTEPGGISVSTGTKIPFDRQVFGRILMPVLLVTVTMFAIAIFAFGYELTSADIPGALIAIPILAYLVHLVFGRKKYAVR